MDILDLIAQWKNKDKSKASNKIKLFANSLDSASYHYISEIIRYWNSLNFITNKTFRSLSSETQLSDKNQEMLIYTTYRFFWEQADILDILSEIPFDLNQRQINYLNLFYQKLTTFNWDLALKNKNDTEISSIKYAIPTFTIHKLLPVLDHQSIINNIIRMDKRVKEGILYLRINTIKLLKTPLIEFSEQIIQHFKKINIFLIPDNTFPFLLKTSSKNKSTIIKSDFYKNNLLIFQDKASIAAVALLNPLNNELIGDLCAAPGMKTSLISQYAKNSTILAGDFNPQRTTDMKSLLSSLGVNNAHTVHWDGINPPLQKGIFDKILLDAPCTGSGTFSSNPELKWRQNNKFLNRNIFLQEKLLISALELLKVGGTLVYSTCSLYPEEGEHQILKLDSKQICMQNTPSWLPISYKINNSVLKGSGRFLPYDHETIGFFVAKLSKK